MGFTIGQVADQIGLSIHTLRYYEKEGIIPDVSRNESGIRLYETKDIQYLQFICCLRATGMSVSDLKEFVRLEQQGDDTIDHRIIMLQKQKDNLASQIKQLITHQEKIDDKINWYRNRVLEGD
ncbi:MerR family transcriptional regulator [Niallia sp. 01092]|uniref:MerR family transcriptional regulator n=1 Tax=unclassified Niallia TaxID=2837522 RepID=UPI003FD5BE48